MPRDVHIILRPGAGHGDVTAGFAQRRSGVWSGYGLATYIAPEAPQEEPPALLSSFPDQTYTQNTGDQVIEAAPHFSGSNLEFTVTGAGASIDAVTGTLTIPTDAVLTGEVVTVSATNSRGSASGAFQVTVEATASVPLTTVSSIQPKGSEITISFAEPTQVYDNGMGEVFAVGSSITVAGHSPALTQMSSGRYINGASLNLESRNSKGPQSMDSGHTDSVDYDISLAPSYPQMMIPGDSLTVGRGRELISTSGWPNHRYGIMFEMVTLTVVSEAPKAARLVTSPAVWTSSFGARPVRSIDVPAYVATLPTFSASGVEIPPYELVMSYLDKHAPLGGLITSDHHANGYENFFPYYFTPAANYGRSQRLMFSAAGLAGFTDAYTANQRENLFARLIHHGHQWFHGFESSGRKMSATGQHNHWRLPMLAMYLIATGQEDKLEYANDRAGGTGDQIFWVTPEVDAMFDPHTDIYKPHFSRVREVVSIGNSPDLPGYYRVRFKVRSDDKDPLRWHMTGMQLQNLANGSLSEPISPNATEAEKWTNPDGILTCRVDVATLPEGIGVGSEMNLVCPWRADLLGNADWRERNNFHVYTPDIRAVRYRGDCQWSGLAMLARLTGAFFSNTHALQNYMERSNTPGLPIPGIEYPGIHAPWENRSTQRTMWEAHWEQIKQIPSVVGYTG